MFLKRNSEAGVVLGAIKEERAMPLTPTSDPLAPYSLPPPGPHSAHNDEEQTELKRGLCSQSHSSACCDKVRKRKQLCNAAAEHFYSIIILTV